MDRVNAVILWCFLLGFINEIQGIVLVPEETVCTIRDWTCKTKQCIKKSELCDGAKNCGDGSDETAEACIHHQCPSFKFQCAYGGCIAEEGECNGVKDCADNSDELSAKCIGNATDNRGKCDSGYFECLSGECILADYRCDGKTDCQDGTDEIVEFCAALVCPAHSFRCGYGACIDEHKKCNGIENCVDGSDETPLLCGRIDPQDGTPPPREPEQCEVGNWPNTIISYSGDSNDRIKPGEFVNNLQDIHIDCPHGFTRYGRRENICLRGKWIVQPIPTCERTCKPINNGISFEVKCSYKRETVKCTDPARPATEALHSCKNGYSRPETSIPQDTIVCRQNGEWDYQSYSCVPICGVEPIKKHTYISGPTINNTDVPWSVAIYTKRQDEDPTKIGPYRHICGGTIVNTRVVISAAHCFWNGPRNEMEDKDDYLVVAGKNYRDIDANEIQPIQRFMLEELRIFPEYHHIHGNYEADIAVLVLERDVIYQNHIKPVCTDVSGAEQPLAEDTIGITAGFGYIDHADTPATNLRVAELQVKNSSNCNIKKGPVFVSIITGDKLCIKGLVADSVCKGDSGGGFTVAKNENSVRKYYLYGVVSHAAGDTNLCSENSYIAFTKIQTYMPLLRDYIIRFRSL